MNSSSHIDKKKKDILILGKGPTQGLQHPEKLHSINFTKEDGKACLSLHYNGVNNYLSVNGTEIIKFKAKDSEIKAYSLCLRNISKVWSDRLRGYVFDLSVDYNTIVVDIRKYLIKKNGTA